VGVGGTKRGKKKNNESGMAKLEGHDGAVANMWKAMTSSKKIRFREPRGKNPPAGVGDECQGVFGGERSSVCPKKTRESRGLKSGLGGEQFFSNNPRVDADKLASDEVTSEGRGIPCLM